MQKELSIIPISEQTSKILFLEPDFIEEVYFEPSNESIWAKHTFTSKPIFLGIIEAKYIPLFKQKLIRIKSWKLIPETNEIQLKIELND